MMRAVKDLILLAECHVSRRTLSRMLVLESVGVGRYSRLLGEEFEVLKERNPGLLLPRVWAGRRGLPAPRKSRHEMRLRSHSLP